MSNQGRLWHGDGPFLRSKKPGQVSHLGVPSKKKPSNEGEPTSDSRERTSYGKSQDSDLYLQRTVDQQFVHQQELHERLLQLSAVQQATHLDDAPKNQSSSKGTAAFDQASDVWPMRDITPPPSITPLKHHSPQLVDEIESFKRGYPGSREQPFQPKSESSTHVEFHSKANHYFCPIAGCDRNKDGKGFMTKGDLKLHQLVFHDPPFACPFCPQVKLFSIDTVLRHVAVRHGNRSRAVDDLEVRVSLAVGRRMLGLREYNHPQIPDVYTSSAKLLRSKRGSAFDDRLRVASPPYGRKKDLSDVRDSEVGPTGVKSHAVYMAETRDTRQDTLSRPGSELKGDDEVPPMSYFKPARATASSNSPNAAGISSSTQMSYDDKIGPSSGPPGTPLMEKGLTRHSDPRQASKPIASAEIDIMSDLKEMILELCSLEESCTVDFRIDWNPSTFLEEQEYEEPCDQAIANAITLTGSSRDAQALSVKDYLVQMWPRTGLQVLQVIQHLLRNTGSHERVVDETLTIGAALGDLGLFIQAKGRADSIAEVGQQLAWLGAALRTSPRDSGVIYTVPYIKNSRSGGRPGRALLDLGFKFEECQGVTFGHDHLAKMLRDRYPKASWQAPRDTNGQCWHALFKNPVIVRGFPIPRRPETRTGLEIPLNMMAALTATRYIDKFNGKYFIKGFSSMLVPTKIFQDILIWHFIYNLHPDTRMSYLDCGVKSVDISSVDLERTRHIVGWCSEAICTVGTLAANYSIHKSNLPNTRSAYALEQAQISGGQLITGTAIFSLGKKDKPVHISRGGFMNQIQWISSKHVIMWDEGEKRGWLVNGASALLHLLRASLEHSKSKLKTAFLLDPNAFADATNNTSAESAIRALGDVKNRDLKLYVDKTEVYDETTRAAGDLQSRTESKRITRYYRLEDKIEHLYSMLEKLIDHQTDVERRSGLQINLRPRRQLEGWDFKDLVADGDPFFPRVATLQTIGKGWVDFARAIHAVTLFGRGFGDLIAPKITGTTSCCLWSSLPHDRYYLAASASDLKDIMENHGDLRENPVRLCNDIVWHMKSTTFQPCPCTTGKSSNHHDPVQVLFPWTFKDKLQKKPAVALNRSGAVIFGHNRKLHWHWGDFGGPAKGDPPEDVQDASSSDDSGLGSSLAPSISPNPSSSGPSSGGTSRSGQPDTSNYSGNGNVPLNIDTSPTDADGGTPQVGTKRPLLARMSSMRKRIRTQDGAAGRGS